GPWGSATPPRQRWARVGGGVAVRLKEGRRELGGLLEPDRAQLGGIALGGSGAELEDLAFEQERRDPGWALARDVQLPDQLVLSQLEIVLRDLATHDLAQLVERRAHRAFDVDRIDAHTNDPRRLAARAADRAEDVIRQAQLVADHVPDPARERVRREDHVGHPGC